MSSSAAASSFSFMEWSVGNYWEVNEDAVQMRCKVTWNLPGAPVEEFQAASLALKLHLNEGVPGRVWESGRPCWIVEVADDGNFPRAAIARQTGLRTAFAMVGTSCRGKERMGLTG